MFCKLLQVALACTDFYRWVLILLCFMAERSRSFPRAMSLCCCTQEAPLWLRHAPGASLFKEVLECGWAGFQLYRRGESIGAPLRLCKVFSEGEDNPASKRTRALMWYFGLSTTFEIHFCTCNRGLNMAGQCMGALPSSLGLRAMQQVPDLLAFQQPLGQQFEPRAQGQGHCRQSFKS